MGFNSLMVVAMVLAIACCTFYLEENIKDEWFFGHQEQVLPSNIVPTSEGAWLQLQVGQGAGLVSVILQTLG